MQTVADAMTGSEPHRDLLSYRSEFPILQNKTYLNSCSLGALSQRSIDGMNEFMRMWAELGASAWYEIWTGKLNELRASYGRIVGAPAGRIALAPSISVAVGGVAGAIDWTKRKKVVFSNLDFPTLGHHFIARKRLGIETHIVESPDRVTVPLELFEKAIDENTALVATSHIYFTSGAIQDVKELARMAHAKGAYILIDAYQGSGQLPTDVVDMGVDFYTSGSLKWLLGGPGITFLYVAPQVAHLEPTLAGWFGMQNQFDFDVTAVQWRDEAARYEMGTPAMAAVYAALGGTSIVEEIGVQRIRERDIALTEHVISRAAEMGFSPRVAPTPEQRTPIVLLDFPEPRPIVAALAKRGIIVDSRPGAVRVSPYFYNTFEENELVLQALREITTQKSR